MLENQKGFGITAILLVVVVVCLVVGLGLYVFRSNEKEKPQQSTNTTSTNLTGLDKLKWERHYGLHGTLLSYKVNTKDYPKQTRAGWEEFTTTRKNTESLIDPYTSTVYVFTDKDPEYGEIQYEYPASCNNERTNFVAANSVQSYAFRLKFSDGIRCSHSL